GRGRTVPQVETRVVLDGAAGTEIRTGSADRLVVGEDAVGHREGRAPEIVDASADAAAKEVGAGALQRLVAAEARGTDDRAALSHPPAAEDVRQGGCGGLVVGQQTVTHGQAGPGLVEDTAAAPAADGLIVGEGAVADGEVAEVVDATPRDGLSVGDRQAV